MISKIVWGLILFPMMVFTATPVMSIKEVIKNSSDHDMVIVEGTLIKQLDHDEFMLSDGTGSIKIEFDDDYFKTPDLPSLHSKIKVKAVVDKEVFEKTKLKIIKFKLLAKGQEEDF